jgi:hypothetical protein
MHALRAPNPPIYLMLSLPQERLWRKAFQFFDENQVRCSSAGHVCGCHAV